MAWENNEPLPHKNLLICNQGRSLRDGKDISSVANADPARQLFHVALPIMQHSWWQHCHVHQSVDHGISLQPKHWVPDFVIRWLIYILWEARLGDSRIPPPSGETGTVKRSHFHFPFRLFLHVTWRWKHTLYTQGQVTMRRNISIKQFQ